VSGQAARQPVWPAVGKFAHGERVWAIQYLLKPRGYRLRADGRFGEQTKDATARFQKRYGLVRDGVAGYATWRALIWNER
jgi:peptidoglycan hydrolase-like protein with peptidoglycan-binding domain